MLSEKQARAVCELCCGRSNDPDEIFYCKPERWPDIKAVNSGGVWVAPVPLWRLVQRTAEEASDG